MSSPVETKPKSESKSKSKSKSVKPKRKPKSKPKDNLIVVFDPGTSVSKILYVVNDGTAHWMTMGAEYFPLPPSRADSLPIDEGMGLPEDNAWIRTSLSGECHTVGSLAGNQQATTSIKKSKKKLLAYKIIAALGAIASREKLPPNFNLELGVLIPYNEHKHTLEDKEWLSDLKQALSSFYFQAQRLKVKLLDFLCVPEGYGIAHYTKYVDDANELKNFNFERDNAAVIMLGYRNTSCLFFRRGTISKAESGTSMLGFHTLLDKIIDKIPTLSKEDLIRAIATETKEEWSYGNNDYKYSEEETKINLANLFRSNDSEKVKLEKQKIELAYSESLNEYWALLSDWLDETLPTTKEIDAMVFGGGSYHLLESQLNEYAVSWDALHLETNAKNNLKKYLLWRNAPDLERFMKENLGVRFADAWGFFLKFANYDKSKTLDRYSGEVFVKNGN